MAYDQATRTQLAHRAAYRLMPDSPFARQVTLCREVLSVLQLAALDALLARETRRDDGSGG